MSRLPLPRPRDLVTLGPHAGAHTVALRAGASMAIPLVALWATGHLELSLYATFGAFTALYGRSHSHLTRLRMQSTAGVVLITTVGIGAAVGVSDARAWIIVPITAVATGATALLSDTFDWHPPGPLFFVFAIAACASVPTEPANIGTALLVAAGSSEIGRAHV